MKRYQAAALRNINMRTALVMALAALIFFIPDVSIATDYVGDLNYKLEQPLVGETSVSSVSAYIILVYQYAVGLIGILAVLLIMFGGYRWVTAAGNEQTISSAKETIISAVTGLLIALLSFSILNFVNPELTNLSFNVQKLDITSVGIDIRKYPPCTAESFKGKDCRSANTGNEGKCDSDQFQCGDLMFNLAEGTYCRAITCADGDCARDPLDVMRFTCLPSHCGDITDGCGRYDGQEDYRFCVCDDYGNESIGALAGAPANFDNISGEGMLKAAQLHCEPGNWQFAESFRSRAQYDCRARFSCILGLEKTQAALAAGETLEQYGATVRVGSAAIGGVVGGPAAALAAYSGAYAGELGVLALANIYDYASAYTADYACIPAETFAK